jgi:catechol 2,3-dioxygenase-like lactoylglutathione lyase family enzyme
MIKKFHHTAISITNLDQSIQFYCDVLGMKLEWRMDHRRSEALEKVVGMKNVDVSYAMLSGWGGRIELFQYHSPQGQLYPADKPQCDKGISHLAFEVDEIDALYEKLVSNGVHFNAPPQIVRPGVKTTYFHDPDGVALEIIQYSEDKIMS